MQLALGLSHSVMGRASWMKPYNIVGFLPGFGYLWVAKCRTAECFCNCIFNISRWIKQVINEAYTLTAIVLSLVNLTAHFQLVLLFFQHQASVLQLGKDAFCSHISVFFCQALGSFSLRNLNFWLAYKNPFMVGPTFPVLAFLSKFFHHFLLS